LGCSSIRFFIGVSLRGRNLEGPASALSYAPGRTPLGNKHREFWYRCTQNFEKLSQAAVSVGCLLFQFRHRQRLFLSEDSDQEGLRVHRANTPRLQMLWSEVAKVESCDDLSNRTRRNWRGRRHPGRRQARPSLPVGDQHSLIQARLIDRLTDSAEGIEPPLATLTLVEEVSDSLFDQFIGTSIKAASKLLLHLLSQIRR
jgi:hypothetical protein